VSRPFALIAGGGTGGHVYPAIAIADALVELGRDRDEIRFVGSARALEASVVPDAGYEITLLPGRGIKRKLTFDNVGAILGLLSALFQAIWLVARKRPRVVISVGGYAAAPAAFAAIALRIPVLVAESNAVPGLVHRIVGRFATASAIAWPDTRLPNATVTGNPVRSDLVGVDRSNDREAARQKLGLSLDRFVVASFGGSLGSGTLNRSMKQLAELCADRSDLALYHVVGKRDWGRTEFEPALTDDATIEYRAVEYEDQMPSLYAAADLIVCRSGATTAAEIALVGIPSILVPLPNAPGDHQTANARQLADAGAAFVIADRECNGGALLEAVEPLIGRDERLLTMAAAARKFAHPEAAREVAQLAVGIARR
jgi:UDP-N-acetylglucosamine--N-acetylmuramyl-(pentapeptide) pyrophosphoryl-undecaprenol N-acetylglucosamine transferase